MSESVECVAEMSLFYLNTLKIITNGICAIVSYCVAVFDGNFALCGSVSHKSEDTKRVAYPKSVKQIPFQKTGLQNYSHLKTQQHLKNCSRRLDLKYRGIQFSIQ